MKKIVCVIECDICHDQIVTEQKDLFPSCTYNSKAGGYVPSGQQRLPKSWKSLTIGAKKYESCSSCVTRFEDIMRETMTKMLSTGPEPLRRKFSLEDLVEQAGE